MSSSNAWSEFAAVFLRTRSAHLEHEAAKAELKSLVPADAQQAFGHGIKAKRSKSGAISSISSVRRPKMQRASESIGALAAALAKAQTLLTNPENGSSRPSARKVGTGESRRFGTHRFPAGSRSCAKCWASTKLRPCRPRRLINPLASSISRQYWRTHRESGLPRIGPCALSVKLPRHAAWGRTHLRAKIRAFCAGRDCRRG